MRIEIRSRLQMTQAALGVTPQATNLLKLDFDFGTSQNNGNLVSQFITVPTVGIESGFTATQSYTYDSLNRLESANETISSNETWKQTFVFDRYGNRNFDEENTTTLTKSCMDESNPVVCAADRKVFNPSVNTATNRLNTSEDYAYDNGGNTTSDPHGRVFKYDGENKQYEVRNSANDIIGQYFFDGNGKRIKKIVPSTDEVTVFVYDAMGRLSAEYSTKLSQAPKVSYTTTDSLGSPRIKTDENGAVISRNDYLPFGEDLFTTQRTQTLGYKSDDVRQKFTGYEKDGETGLDFAQARMYANKLGRFTTVDPVKISLDRVIDPQQINRYAYVRNNPQKYVDLDGRDLVLKPGMKKADVDRIIKNHVKMYRKESGRAALEKQERSKVTIEVGTGQLDGRKFGETQPEGKATRDNQGVITRFEISKIGVTYDFEKIDQATDDFIDGKRSQQPDSQEYVTYHEGGHTDSLITNPTADANMSYEDAEAGADDFAKKLEKEKDTLDKKAAEKRVKEMFDYNSYEFVDKKKKKEEK